MQCKIHSAKLHFESDLIYDLAITGCPNIYKYLRKFTNQHQLPPTIYHDSKAASSDHDKACMFNEYFHSVFTNSSFELPSSHLFPTPTAFLDHIEFSDVDVYTELLQLDSTKAIGIDGIGPKVLKPCALSLYHPIHHLFSTSLATRSIPAE